jgi:hypothetical protein
MYTEVLCVILQGYFRFSCDVKQCSSMERFVRNICNELVDGTVSCVGRQPSFKEISFTIRVFVISKNRHLDSRFAGFNRYTYPDSKHGRERERERGRERKK